MKLTAKQRASIQTRLEDLGWRAVDTGSGFFLEEPDRLTLFHEGFIYPKGHPAKLPDPIPWDLITAQ